MRRLRKYEIDGVTQIASVAPINPEGKLLFGRRRDDKKWTLPGGHMDEGEPPARGAIRELMEETGLKPTSLSFLGAGPVVGRDGKKLMIHCFIAEVDGIPSSEADPDQEVSEWRWVDIKEGLPEEIAANLSARKNVTLQLMGLQNSHEGNDLSKAEEQHPSQLYMNLAQNPDFHKWLDSNKGTSWIRRHGEPITQGRLATGLCAESAAYVKHRLGDKVQMRAVGDEPGHCFIEHQGRYYDALDHQGVEHPAQFKVWKEFNPKAVARIDMDRPVDINWKLGDLMKAESKAQKTPLDKWRAAAEVVQRRYGHAVPNYNPSGPAPDPRHYETAYHTTLAANLPSISMFGLLPRPHQHLDPEDVGTFVERDEDGAAIYQHPDMVMLRLRAPGIGSTEDGEDVVQEPVHPDHIEVRVGDQWKPLRTLHPITSGGDLTKAQKPVSRFNPKEMVQLDMPGFETSNPLAQGLRAIHIPHREGGFDGVAHYFAGREPVATVGYYKEYRSPNTIHLEHVIVRPKFQGQGVGTKVVHHFRDWLNKKHPQYKYALSEITSLGSHSLMRGALGEPYSVDDGIRNIEPHELHRFIPERLQILENGTIPADRYLNEVHWIGPGDRPAENPFEKNVVKSDRKWCDCSPNRHIHLPEVPQEDLEKAQVAPSLPGLGIERRPVTPIVDRNSLAYQSKLRTIQMDHGREIRDAFDHPAIKGVTLNAPRASGFALRSPGDNLDVATQHHEDLHAMLNAVEMKYGLEARRGLVKRILKTYPKESLRAQAHFAASRGVRIDDPDFGEEVLAHSLHYLNNGFSRQKFWQTPQAQKMKREGIDEREFDRRMKVGFRAFQAAARAIKGSDLMGGALAKMAIADIPPGTKVKDGVYDYSHVLDPKHRASGYSLQVFDGLRDGWRESTPDDSPVELEAVLLHKGKGIGSVQGYRPHDPMGMEVHSGIDHKDHRGQGLGVKMYEAIYAHARNRGIKSVSGSYHTEEAGRVHDSLARRHGIDYLPDSGLEDDDHSRGPYSYTIKSELGSTPRGMIDPQGTFYPIEDDINIDHRRFVNTGQIKPIIKNELAKAILEPYTGPRGMIDPQGNFYPFSSDDYHPFWFADHTGFHPNPTFNLTDEERNRISGHFEQGLKDGWVSIGSAWADHILGHKNTLNDPNHPAMVTARQLARKWGQEGEVPSVTVSGDTPEEFQTFSIDHRRFINTGQIRPIIKSEGLAKMAIADIPPGVKIPMPQHYEYGQATDFYDYSHVLPPKLRAKGYTLTLWHPTGDHPLTRQPLGKRPFSVSIEQNGKGIGSVQGQKSTYNGALAVQPHSGVHKDHRGQGLGKAAYEALYAHAMANGYQYVEGNGHTEAAANVHMALAAKHGLDYRRVPQVGFGNGSGPFGYALKSEWALNKGEGYPRGMIDPQGTFHSFQDKHHPEWYANHTGTKYEGPNGPLQRIRDYEESHKQGWITVGSAWQNNIMGHKDILSNPNHPATMTARKVARDMMRGTLAVHMGADTPEEYRVFGLVGNDIRRFSNTGEIREEEIRKDEDDLFKSHPGPRFPGLGLPDDRRETPVVSTDLERKNKRLAVAIQYAHGSYSTPAKNRRIHKKRVKRELAGMKSWQGAVVGNPGAALSFAEAQDSVASQLHENHHLMMNRVSKLYGENVRDAISHKLVTSLPQEQQQALHLITSPWYDPKDSLFHEESIACLIDHLNSAKSRKAVYNKLSIYPDQARALENNLKLAYQGILATARTLTPEKLKQFGLAKAEEDEITRLMAHPDPTERSMALKLSGVSSRHFARALTSPHVDLARQALNHPYLDGYALLALMGGPHNEGIQLEALNHPAVDDRHLLALHNTIKEYPTANKEVALMAIGRHPALTESAIRELWDDGVVPKTMLLDRSNVPRDLLDTTLRDHLDNPDDKELAKLANRAARNPGVDPQLLTRSLIEGKLPVRLAASTNPVVPAEAIETLLRHGVVPKLDDPDVQVRLNLLRGSKVTADHLDIALENHAPEVRHAVFSAHHALKPRHVAKALRGSFQDALVALRSPQADAEHERALLDHPDPQMRILGQIRASQRGVKKFEEELGEFLGKVEPLSKMAVQPQDFKMILKGIDERGQHTVDHMPELSAHPPAHNHLVEAYRFHVLDKPEPVKIKGKNVGGGGISRKVIYEVPSGFSKAKYMVKPYHEDPGNLHLRKWCPHLHQGWAEMTNQALYHAGGIGDLHQRVHVAEHNMGPGHEKEPALVVHLERGFQSVREHNPKPLNNEERRNVRKIALMDFVTGNLDRHAGNLMFDKSRGKVLAIDHSRSFQYINTHPNKGRHLRELRRMNQDDSLYNYLSNNFSIVGHVDPIPRQQSDYDSTGRRMSDQQKLERIDKHRDDWQEVVNWWGENSEQISKALDERLAMIKDPKLRAHIKRNFEARREVLDQMAEFGLDNFGRDDWYHQVVPVYKPNEFDDQEYEKVA